MNDNRIIELLFERAEIALDEVSNRYSLLYKRIIREVVSDECDVEECGNDVLLAVWNSIPPNRPNNLSAYICKIARRIGVDKLRYNTRKKRNIGYTVMLSELDECLPATEAINDKKEFGEVTRSVLSEFLLELELETQILFVRRYMYLESVTDLAKRFELDEGRISVKLYRARKKLKAMLENEGINI